MFKVIMPWEDLVMLAILAICILIFVIIPFLLCKIIDVFNFIKNKINFRR